ncbi:MAG: hypothetical protein F9K16_05090 [Thermoanaerobaculia bacterium]|nr:MAG: hypothetical protein F9K16_05090 [Thermoanaerobaculia bacterium]
MPTSGIEEFARLLVQNVRDSAIRSCEILTDPEARSPAALRWRAAGVRPEKAKVVIPDVVDEAVFCLLNAVDQGLLKVKFMTGAGREVDLTEEGSGELAGWYMGSGGWRAMFSEEPFVDDFADLT